MRGLIPIFAAIFSLVLPIAVYLFARHSFRKAVEEFLIWMKSPLKDRPAAKPPAMLKPLQREVEKLNLRLRVARQTANEVSKVNLTAELWTPDRLKAHAVAHFGTRNFIVVSNREPYLHSRKDGNIRVSVPVSGLVTALDPILRSTSGMWIAHGAGDADRETADSEGKVMVPPESPAYALKRVWLTREEEARYYYGFSNEALWPLCHLAHERPVFDERDWAAYRRVNEKFADAVLAECGKERPFILVQDYHFTLLPRLIRERRPDAVIGLFWHIPWPSHELFQICPWKEEILRGMLGANFIGFHLQSYCANFFQAVNSQVRVRVDWEGSRVRHRLGTTEVKPFPISIQPWSERVEVSDRDFSLKAQEIRRSLKLDGVWTAVSVDRLDYTKGIPERLHAIERFFEKYPEYLGRVSFIQLGAPSRGQIPRYRKLAEAAREASERINWKYQSALWRPVIHLEDQHDFNTVYHFMRMADACIVSSLADGMNLVAKEFVAAREEYNGTLILSEFTGAARELEEALTVNPYAGDEFADAIRRAVEMPLAEQRRRMTRLREQVQENNVYRWASDLITEMARFADAPAGKIELQKAAG